MTQRQSPTSFDPRRLRQLHRKERCPIDLASLVDAQTAPAGTQVHGRARRRLWPWLASAAGVAIAAMLLAQWDREPNAPPIAALPPNIAPLEATTPRQAMATDPPPGATETSRTTTSEAAQLESATATSVSATKSERRPVLPGMFTTNAGVERLAVARMPSRPPPPRPPRLWPERPARLLQPDNLQETLP